MAVKVLVRSLQERGRYRSGRFWPSTPTEAVVGEEELERLEADPVLNVRVLGEVSRKTEPENLPAPAGATAGTPLPSGFPHKKRLEAAGFTSLEAVQQAQAVQFYSKKFKKAEVEKIQAEAKLGASE